jgi:hypothetical protein
MSTKVTKIIKTGYGMTIGSGFGFGSWTIPATHIELTGEWDLSTEDGRAQYQKAMDACRKLAFEQVRKDLEYAESEIKELKASVEQRKRLVEKALENE